MPLFTTLLHIAQDVLYDFWAELTSEFLPRYMPGLAERIRDDPLYLLVYVSISRALSIPQHQRHSAALARWRRALMEAETPEEMDWATGMVFETIWRERGWRFI